MYGIHQDMARPSGAVYNLVLGNNVWNSPRHDMTRWGGLLWSRIIMSGIHQDTTRPSGVVYSGLGNKVWNSPL